MGNDTLQGGPAGVNLDAKKYEELISMGIAERLDKVPYLENQDKFFTSSIDREVASDSFSPIYQIAVFGWLHMVQWTMLVPFVATHSDIYRRNIDVLT